MTQNQTKFNTKDYLAVVLYAILAYFISAIVGTALSFLLPIAWPFVSGICLFPVSLVYLLLDYRVAKRGAMLGFSLVLGMIYVIMGIPIMLPYSLVLGLLAEWSLGSQPTNYRRLWRQTVAYGIYAAGFGYGDLFTFYVLGSQFFEKMKYTPSLIAQMQIFASNPLWSVANLLFTFVMALLGCWLSEKILNKHFRKAGYLA